MIEIQVWNGKRGKVMIEEEKIGMGGGKKKEVKEK